MSSYKIQLPDFLLAELFKDSLVVFDIAGEKEIPLPIIIEEEIPAAPAKVPTELIKYLGQNKKNIVVLVNEPKALIINDNELDFLTKILTACNLNLADIAIVNVHKQHVDYTNLKEQLNSEFFLLLGVEPSSLKLPFMIPHFQVQPYAGATFVFTPSLNGMLSNSKESRLMKSKLWLSLKTAFKL